MSVVVCSVCSSTLLWLFLSTIIKAKTKINVVTTEKLIPYLLIITALFISDTELYLSLGSKDIDFETIFFKLHLMLLAFIKASIVLPIEYISERKSVC